MRLTQRATERIAAKVREVIRCHAAGYDPSFKDIERVEQWANNQYREPRVLKITGLTDDGRGFTYIGNGEDVAILPHITDAVALYAQDMPELTEREFETWRENR